MRQIYLALFSIALSVTANAQTNLIPNGNFETWTNNTTPSGFTAVNTETFSANNFITRETSIFKSGASAVKHQSQDDTQTVSPTDLIPVIPGNNYTISYWFLDNDTKARSRAWHSWVNISNGNESELTDHRDILHPTTYSSNNAQWVQASFTLTAPTNATHFRFQARTYRQSATSVGGFIYYDDFSMVNNTPMGLTDHQIDGLKLYPNPASNNDNLYITSTTGSDKTIEIYDILGKQVLNLKSENNNPIQLSNLNTGVYLLKITEEGKTATQKLIIK
ncbi:T9SS type A sorting domain-containing protein [Flavobacterium supellecticarium]|uniref:T9SS type A sorting domain-containing protein n=1 Tax=Flavobacterium supellecticarium TaxID=2565924 RepID=A0A4S3ZSH0_9FLAO|nr:T9SS type A sorting domain-containing protein [Flavobacterium supellecticarium]THF48519.1 T9SS type A sorting domain-containing protein [Flavobacterium supellecticarium]